jgi:beta-glucosidase
MSILFLARWLLVALAITMLIGCSVTDPTPQSTPLVTTTPAATAPDYRAPDAPVAARVAALLSRMSLAEKIGQMTQVEKNSITPEDVTAYFVGSVLSGGGGSPRPNTPEAWRAMVAAYQEAALATPLGIPLLYGVDAVHGHNNLRGATIFPHNIGLGATADPALVEEIARVTAAGLHATGVHWNFAPVVAVTQDIRWGRTYESYGEATALVSDLGAAFVRGTQGAGILATPKHFIGDGATAFGSSTTGGYLLDQGDARLDEATLRRVHLPPYQAALAAGARSVMASFSSWNGDKVHGSRFLLTDLLKDELDFDGFVVSDWQAIDQLPGDYYSDVVTAINAGVDMVMTPYDYRTFIATLTRAVEQGDVSQARIDDAVSRILRVKFEQGLFEQPLAAEQDFAVVGGAAHRALARSAVQRSLVLLKNEDVLPLAADARLLLVAGAAADDIGRQAGGWTIEWQGGSGDITEGTSILDGIRAAVAPATQVEFDRFGRFEGAGGRRGRAAAGGCVHRRRRRAALRRRPGRPCHVEPGRQRARHAGAAAPTLCAARSGDRQRAAVGDHGGTAAVGCTGGGLAAGVRGRRRGGCALRRGALHRQTAFHLAGQQRAIADQQQQRPGAGRPALPARLWADHGAVSHHA